MRATERPSAVGVLPTILQLGLLQHNQSDADCASVHDSLILTNLESEVFGRHA